jgi:hypothetical protein
MIELSKLIWYGLIGLFRSRASLEIEILVLRHQLNILRWSSPKRPILGRLDRWAFVGLYGPCPYRKSNPAGGDRGIRRCCCSMLDSCRLIFRMVVDLFRSRAEFWS